MVKFLKDRVKTIEWDKFFEVLETPYSILKITPSKLNSNMDVIYFLNSLANVSVKRNKSFKIIGGNILDLFMLGNDVTLEVNKSVEKRPIWWEVYYENESVHFYMYVPQDQERKLRYQIQRTWKQCTVQTVDVDYMPKWEEENTSAIRLDLKKHNALSLATERNINPLNGILQSFRVLEETDKALFQVGMQYNSSWTNDMKDILDRFKEGYVPKKWNGIDLKGTFNFAGWLVGIVIEEVFNIVGELINPKHEDVRDMWNSRKVKMRDISPSTKSKYSRTAFHTNINVVVQSDKPESRDTFIRGVESSMYDMNEDNEWVSHKITGKGLKLVNNRKLTKKNKTVLSDKEHSKIISLPDKDMQRDFKHSIKSEEGNIAEPPKDLFDSSGIPFATFKNNKGEEDTLYIPTNSIDDFVKSKYFLGATRSGKSTAGENFVVECFKKGFGSCFIDIADGNTIENIISVLSEKEREKTAYLNFASAVRSIPIGFNELLINNEKAKENINVIETEVIYFFETLSEQPLNMRARRWLGKAVRAVMNNPDATILDVVLMMTDKKFREGKIGSISDPFIKRDWEVKWEEQFTDKQRNQIINECFNRLDLLLDNTTIRNTVCLDPLKDDKGNYVMDFRKFMDEGWLVCVQLPEKDLKASEAIASLLVSKMFLTSLDRRKKDKPFHLVIDEPHKVIKSADRMKRILVECAKHRFSTLLLIHEWSQLAEHDKSLPPTCINNCGHFIYFRTGTDNLKPAKHKFEPHGYDYNQIPSQIQQPGEGLAVISSKNHSGDSVAPIKLRGIKPLDERYKQTKIKSVLKRDTNIFSVDEKVASESIFLATANMDTDGIEDNVEVPAAPSEEVKNHPKSENIFRGRALNPKE